MYRYKFNLNPSDPPVQSSENRVCVVTVCKGRLHHIQQTLPLIVAQSPDELIVVDYDCPQGVGDWVEANFPSVKVVRVHDEQGFCVARGRNVGAQNSTSPWICFIDADIKMAPGFIPWMRQNLFPRFFYRCDLKGDVQDLETYGTCICHREAFEALNGYDELYRGWGGEDNDLYERLKRFNSGEAYYPADFVSAISHDDTERVTFYPEKNKINHHINNSLYLTAKLQIMAFLDEKKELPLDLRQQIDAEIKQALNEWDKNPAGDFPKIEITMKANGWLPSPYKMRKEVSFRFSLEEREKP